MTERAAYQRKLWQEHIDLSCYSFMLFYYATWQDLKDGTNELLTPYRFPSVQAACEYIKNVHPEVFYYDVELTDQKPDCPLPYILIK